MSSIISAISDVISSLFEVIGAVFTTILHVFESGVNAVVSFFSGIINMVLDLFKGVFDAAGGVGKFVVGESCANRKVVQRVGWSANNCGVLQEMRRSLSSSPLPLLGIYSTRLGREGR